MAFSALVLCSCDLWSGCATQPRRQKAGVVDIKNVIVIENNILSIVATGLCRPSPPSKTLSYFCFAASFFFGCAWDLVGVSQ